MSFLSASFVTILVASFALLFLFRQRDLGLRGRLGGLLAIFLASCLVFSGMFYVFIEYIYNQGPDDWGVIGYARTAVENKLGVPWAKIRIIEFYPSFTDAGYKVSYALPDGKNGMVICLVDYSSGKFTSADVQPAK